ncbi:hypothetical protein RMATCC62417_18058 [Rhizopus microsporus]|nr:hypothetical protein RMATCC62417_18058 [Rhizopus microsporus]
MNNLANNIQYSLQHYAAMTQAQLLNATPSSQQQQQQQQQPLIQGINYPTLSLLRMTTPPQLHQPTIASPSSSSSGKEDCNAPIRVTRPPNAYLLFNKKMRRILKDQDPTMNVGEISKQIADRWKRMTQEEKDIYIKEANRLKEEQRALHPNSMYIRRSRAELIEAGKITKEDDNNTPESDKKKRGKKRTKNPGIPKHPLSAYMWYLTEVRPKTMKKFPSSNVGQISKYCAEKWHSMTDEERAPWKTKAQVDKDRYAREMQLYAIQNDHELGRGTRQKYRHAIVAAAAAASATSTVSTPSTASGHTTDCLLDSALFNKEYDPSLLISAPTSPSSILRANTSGQSHTNSLMHAPEDEFVNH